MSKLKFNADFLSDYAQREFNPQETLQWLKQDQTIYWSWGVSKLVNMDNQGLLLRVNGHHLNGWVLITLDWNDTYTVRYLTSHFNESLESDTNVYCDVLQRTIDNKIERINEYK
jgi:hypothetical protein